MKSSAVLIALIVGAALTAILTLSILNSQGAISSILKSNDEGIARSIARSSVEKGLLQYKVALENKKNDEVYLVSKEDNSSEAILNIKMDSISYGQNFNASDWQDQAKLAEKQGALALKNSEDLNIDLGYAYKFSNQKNKPTSIEIKFSNPFARRNGLLERISADTVISYELTDTNGSGKLISKGKSNSSESHLILVEGLSNCMSGGASCKLKISSGLPESSAIAFIKIQAKSSMGVIEPSQDRPGTIVIDSVGSYGHAKVELKAKYDALGGKYLGIFY